jgi:hypothetical protein
MQALAPPPLGLHASAEVQFWPCLVARVAAEVNNPATLWNYPSANRGPILPRLKGPNVIAFCIPDKGWQK